MGELLNNLRVASPCSADWNQMAGDERVRHCSQCNLNVYNLSAMTTREAEELVSQREGRTCVRFYRRKDGTILTQNCPVGWNIVVRRVSRMAGIALSAVMAAIPIAAESHPAIQGQAIDADSGLDIEVVDVSGAACAGAKIELSKAGNNDIITATANHEGFVRLTHLSPGTYEATVTYPGFESQKHTVTINERKTIHLKPTLIPAATQGVVGEATFIAVPAINAPLPLLGPVPVPKPSSNRRGFFRHIFGKLFHFSR